MSISAKVATAIALLVAVAGAGALAIALTDQAALRRDEFRRSSVERLQLLALALAPAVAAEQHARVQAVLDNVANYPERFPDLETLEVLDREGRVIADLDPRDYGVRRTDEATRADLRRRSPLVREVGSEHLSVVVPVRLAHPLGVIRASLDDRRWHGDMERITVRAAALMAGTGIVLAAALYVFHRRAVGVRIARLAHTAARLGEGRLDARAPAQGSDEIARLGGTFNRMAQALQAHTADLERLVAERTAALQGANERLAQLAITDPLTGLFNRRHFEDGAARDLEVARRAGRPFSVVVLDVDRFKSINDRFGHVAGDVVLKDLALVLMENARATDLVARVGGEEFAIAMPDATAEEAERAAERMRRHLEATRHPDAPSLGGVVVTASFGVAAHPQDGRTLLELLSVADGALYVAKEAGRNRVSRAGMEGRSSMEPSGDART